MDRMTIIGPAGAAHQVLTIPLGSCPYRYAANFARKHHRKEQNFSYQLEISGKKFGPYDADELVTQANELFGSGSISATSNNG